MRYRLAGLVAATAIATSALVACSPPNENPSDIKVTDQTTEMPEYSAPPATAENPEEPGAADTEGNAPQAGEEAGQPAHNSTMHTPAVQ